MKAFPRWLRRLCILLVVLAALGTGFYLTRDALRLHFRAYAIGTFSLAAEHSTLFLPSVDRLEISVLGKPDDKTTGEFDNGMEHFPVIRHVKIRGEDAERLAGMWRDLSAGWAGTYHPECHDPNYGLVFWHNDEVVLKTSICWKCGTFVVPTHLGCGLWGFRVKERSSQELLTALRATLPDVDTSVPVP